MSATPFGLECRRMRGEQRRKLLLPTCNAPASSHFMRFTQNGGCCGLEQAGKRHGPTEQNAAHGNLRPALTEGSRVALLATSEYGEMVGSMDFLKAWSAQSTLIHAGSAGMLFFYGLVPLINYSGIPHIDKEP